MLKTKWRFLIMLITGVIIAFIMRAILPLPDSFDVNNPRNLFFAILQSISITVLTWESTLWFDRWMNRYFPWEKSFVKHFLIVMVGGITLCVIYFITVGLFFYHYLCPFPLLQNENLFSICLIVALNVTLMILFIEFGVQLFFKWKASLVEIEQYKLQTAQAKLENLKHQINPHFLFNNMSVLTSLIYKDQDKAADFVQQLSKVYRYLLDNSSSELVCLKDEMKFLESYIYLLQIRYSPNLTIENTVASKEYERLIPPFTMQLLLENAIKHNEVSAEKPLKIDVYMEDEMLVVKNNRNPRISEEPSTQKGLKNIRSRYSYFTNRAVEIVDLPQTFIVKIPLLTEA